MRPCWVLSPDALRVLSKTQTAGRCRAQQRGCRLAWLVQQAHLPRPPPSGSTVPRALVPDLRNQGTPRQSNRRGSHRAAPGRLGLVCQSSQPAELVPQLPLAQNRCGDARGGSKKGEIICGGIYVCAHLPRVAVCAGAHAPKGHPTPTPEKFRGFPPETAVPLECGKNSPVGFSGSGFPGSGFPGSGRSGCGRENERRKCGGNTGEAVCAAGQA